VGPPAYASSSHSSVLLLASVAVSRMPCPAVRHGMPASWRAVPRAAPGPERPDLSQGAGSGTNWGRSRGRRERHQHSHAARAVPRTGRPSGWVCRPGCTRGLGICWFAVVAGLLGHRGSLAATSMRSTSGAPTIWLDRVGLGVRRRKAANTATPARHSRWFLRRLDPVPQEAAQVFHPIGRRGTRPFRLPPPCWAPPNAALVWSAAAGFIGVR